MYGSWDMECDRQNLLSFLTDFCPYTPYEPRKSKFWKHENNTWRYYHFTHVYHKWQSHDVWFLRHEAWQTEFFIILDPFLPFYPPNNTKNQNLKKLKKTHEDTIVLHMYGIYDNHMMYGSWDKEHGRQNLLSLWTVFCPYTPPMDPENQNFENMKIISGDIMNLHMHTINDSHMMYGSWDMKPDKQNFLSFWTIFRPFTLLTPWKSNVWKMKKHLDISSFYNSVPKIMITWCTVAEIGCATDRWTDGWTDRQMEKVTRKNYHYII